MPSESSDFSMKREECPRCGALWLNGQHYWSTGKIGNEKDLSNLVCGQKDFNDCINPIHKRGHTYGEADSWIKRAHFIDNIDKYVFPRVGRVKSLRLHKNSCVCAAIVYNMTRRYSL